MVANAVRQACPEAGYGAAKPLPVDTSDTFLWSEVTCVGGERSSDPDGMAIEALAEKIAWVFMWVGRKSSRGFVSI